MPLRSRRRPPTFGQECRRRRSPAPARQPSQHRAARPRTTRRATAAGPAPRRPALRTRAAPLAAGATALEPACLRRPGPPARGPGYRRGDRPGRVDRGRSFRPVQGRCLRRVGPSALRPGTSLRGPGLPALDPGARGCPEVPRAPHRAPQAARPRPPGPGRTAGGALHLDQAGGVARGPASTASMSRPSSRSTKAISPS